MMAYEGCYDGMWSDGGFENEGVRSLNPEGVDTYVAEGDGGIMME